MKISNNNPFTKTIKTVHFLFSDSTPFSLSEVLKNSSSGLEFSEDYLKVSVLPENVRIASGQKEGKSGASWSHRIALHINEQNEEIRKMLDSYDNGLVIPCLETTGGTIHVYGNRNQPLSFSYKDVESLDNIQLIGHEIIVKGDTYHSYKVINTVDFYSPSRLASWLATSL
ncbi:hypothetical protein [Aquimarina algiphila]|uniref:Uncharacterized protein n=1 Tax=Aquimarina algiphila TaxID=2047982 RepID=A0A554VAT5_9FLAO|nr:hypothetical protein [Aquimarina algiphila]TSE03390.1 hypothetical protein FOF46_29425 [Aquimarina algiphila]